MIQYNDLQDAEKAKRYREEISKKPRVGHMPVAASHELSGEVPAGYRVPKPFKKTFVDKIPEWIEKCKEEGKDLDQTKDMLRQKELKYIEKWGNKSRVGAIINNYNIESLNTALEARAQPQSMTCLSPMSGKISQRKSERLSSLPSIKRRNLDSVRKANQSLALKS